MGIYVIRVPDIGEGIAEVELVTWNVQPGDSVTEDQHLADVMTDKATVEVPSPVHGKVISLGGADAHIELKTGDFKPEYAGQLNFYLSAVDGILKKEQDNPSIGLLLCKSKNNVVAEYSLKDISKPIGESEYKITSSLPDALEKQLPSVEDIQKRIK